MSWSYSGDPSKSLVDKCRFMIGDTDEEQPIMQDEEIQFIVDTYPEENMMLYQLFSRAATLFARDIKRSLGPESEDPTERLKFFKEQMEHYKALSTCSGLSVPLYSAPKVFRKGMNSNPPNLNRGGRYV